MKRPKILPESIISSLGVLLYILAVGWIIMHGHEVFGDINNLWGPLIFLLLFVFSAMITGMLVMGRPLWLYIEGNKQDAIRLLFYNTTGLFILLLLILLIKIVFGKI